MDTFIMACKVILYLIIIIAMILLTAKLVSKGTSRTTSSKYTKVLERIQISKDSSILVIKTGEEGMVILTSPSHTEKLKDLTKEEIRAIELKKEESIEEMNKMYEKIISTSKEKIGVAIARIKLKDDKHEF